MKYPYILLDWDGNLVQTLDIWLEACRLPLQKRGVQLSDTDIAAGIGASRKYIEAWGIDDIEDFLAEMHAIGQPKLADVVLYPNALEVLQALYQKGHKLALITTAAHAYLDPLLEKHDVDRFFDVVIAYEDSKLHKPHAEPLEKALQKLGATKEQAVMVGDSDKDLGAAVNAGLDSVLFYPPDHQKFYNLEALRQHNPTHVVHDFRDILTLV